ncbi:MAG: MGH1-like glycoside hydrolase domain-containing protein, partial [Spirochaetaceae bacterium]
MNSTDAAALERIRSKLTPTSGDASFGGGCVTRAFAESRVAFVSGWTELEAVFDAAASALGTCIRDHDGSPLLQEGGVYDGCWLESTGTANAEVLSRFVPDAAESTMLAFARYQRADGLIPYKIGADGPVFRQIQLVTPPVRSAWHHYRVANAGHAFLARVYDAYSAYDRWLAANRDTRGTGCIEAFCTYDTGHDLSPRFWHVPESPFNGEPDRYDPYNPRLPFIAPDLTASVACSRDYLARIATETGQTGTGEGAFATTAEGWEHAARQMREALLRQCFDDEDRFFYDRDAHNEFVRVQSDVLLRVLAGEAVDTELFEELLRSYLLNTRKFYSHVPFTSIALDDPRFFQSSEHNSWAGAVNFLTVIRAPHMFEHYGHPAEFMTAANQLMQAFAGMTSFPQCLNPWTGEEGYTELYSPAILSVLDYIERMHGVQAATDGSVWCNARPAIPSSADRPRERSSAYRRTISGNEYELVCG